MASVANAGVVMGTAALAVPMILHRVGTSGYGAWTLAGAIVIYASILETGVGPALQREVAISAGSGEFEQVERALWTMLVLYLCFGVLAIAVLWLSGPTVARIIDLHEPLRSEAESAFRLLGLPLSLVLLGAGLGNILQGLGRFVGVATSAASGGLTYLLAIAVLVGPGQLTGLVWAATVQQVTVCLARAVILRDVWLAGRPPRILPKDDARRVLGFSTRLQPRAVSELFNWQSDKVVVGVIASASTLAHLGIGQQISDAGRLVSGAMLNPMVASFAHIAGTGNIHDLRHHFYRLHRVWLIGIFGGSIIGAATAYPLVVAWVGNDNRGAAGFGAILILASAFGMSTGTGLAYLRALGRVSLEAHFGMVILLANTVLTILLALVVGPYGVVLGTLGAYAFGANFFFRRLRREIQISPIKTGREAFVIIGGAIVSAALSFAWGMSAATLLPVGVALVPVGFGAIAAFLMYMWLVMGLRLKALQVRTWLQS